MSRMDEETEWSNSKGKSIHVKCSKTESKFQFLLGCAQLLMNAFIFRAKSTFADSNLAIIQSYVIKSAPWTILWFRILGIFSVENIRGCVFLCFKLAPIVSY